MSLLEVESLSVARGEVQTLHKVSLSVAEGEMVAILGANGAGKTTLLRALSGLLPINGGTVRLDGERIEGSAPHHIARLGLVHVPEGRGILAEMTVFENLRLGMIQHGWRGRQAELNRVFALFPVLEARKAQFAGMLSGGEQQMLAIARSLLARPRLLMIDELSLGLAPKVTQELIAVLSGLRSAGQTVLIVEQNAQQALKFADRIYVLSQGAVVLSGSAAEIARDPDLLSAYLGRD